MQMYDCYQCAEFFWYFSCDCCIPLVVTWFCTEWSRRLQKESFKESDSDADPTDHKPNRTVHVVLGLFQNHRQETVSQQFVASVKVWTWCRLLEWVMIGHGMNLLREQVVSSFACLRQLLENFPPNKTTINNPQQQSTTIDNHLQPSTTINNHQHYTLCGY